jgi:hypothetical protein
VTSCRRLFDSVRAQATTAAPEAAAAERVAGTGPGVSSGSARWPGSCTTRWANWVTRIAREHRQRHSGCQRPPQLCRQPDRAGRLPGTQRDGYRQPAAGATGGVAARWRPGGMRCLPTRWRVDDFKLLAEETRSFSSRACREDRGHQGATAGDHDGAGLPGSHRPGDQEDHQVAQELETQLMEVLIETLPGERRTESVNSLLNGPVINADGRRRRRLTAAG